MSNIDTINLVKKKLATLPIEEKKKKIQTAIKKINIIINKSSDLFKEREDVIKTIMISFITGTHHLQYGPAGTSKSMIVRFLKNSVSKADYFETLLTKSSDESQLFGPYSLQALERDEYVRNTKFKLPEANFAFIDEVYNANSSVLNSLLAVMNERIYHNGNDILNLPLISLFGASNIIPDENTTLDALHDRFLLRLNVEDIKNASNMIEIYKTNLNEGFNSEDLPKITIGDILILQDYAKKAKINENILKDYTKLMIQLRNDGINISTRRQVNLLKVAQAQSVLNLRKNNTVCVEDFNLIRYGLWRKVEDFDIINKIFEKFISPYEYMYAEILEESKKYINEYNNINKKSKSEKDESDISKELIVINKLKSLQNQIKDYIKINLYIPNVFKQNFSKLQKELENITSEFFNIQSEDLLLSPISKNNSSKDDDNDDWL